MKELKDQELEQVTGGRQDEERIRTKVCGILREYSDAESAAGKDRIMEDLGCDSLDVVDIISSVEKTFQLKIPKETFIGIRTVDDLVNTVTANLKLR